MDYFVKSAYKNKIVKCLNNANTTPFNVDEWIDNVSNTSLINNLWTILLNIEDFNKDEFLATVMNNTILMKSEDGELSDVIRWVELLDRSFIKIHRMWLNKWTNKQMKSGKTVDKQLVLFTNLKLAFGSVEIPEAELLRQINAVYRKNVKSVKAFMKANKEIWKILKLSDVEGYYKLIL